jgi:PAS domain S-box-containing protein
MYVDPQLKQLLGYRDDEIRNHLDDWRQRVHPDDREAVRTRAQACIDDGLDAYELEHRMLHKNGSLRWFVARGSIIKRADGTPYRIVGTETDITERKRAEQEIHENEAALRASNEEIQNLAGRLIVAQEAERTRIARDLHDDVSQQLAGISIALSNLKRHVGRQTEAEEQAQGALTSLQQRTIALAENVRFLSHDLHPGVLTHAGLVAALKGHCDELRRQHAVDVTFRAGDDLGAIGPEAELCLYRVAQEVLRNTVRHAQASHATVLLVRSTASAELTITDDGKGFDSARTGGRTSGLGLLSINERVRLAGGTVRVMTELNKGTSVRVRIPIKADPEIGRSDGPEDSAPSEDSVSHAS